jgi:tripartite-type tricarboxylate transporter receptor subunit TctC
MISTQKFTLTLLALSVSALAAPTQAATFPTEPIKFIVPYAPGGTTDLVARTVSKKVSEDLGQPVIVENKPGAGGNIGMAEVAKAKPDGYTVGMGAISTNAVNPHLYKEMRFDPTKDFTPIVMLGTSTIVLEVNPSVPVSDVQGFVDYAKQHPDLIYGAAGTGTSMHLAGVLFGQMTNTQLEHVAYKGSAPALTDLMGGQIQVMFDNLPASLPHIKAGKLKALAVTSARRSDALPDVPTVEEAGGPELKGFEASSWFGLLAPAGTPPEIVQRIQQEVAKALATPAVKERLVAQGAIPGGNTPAEFTALIDSEHRKWAQVVKASGAKVD